jgi:hypothetical protein
MAAGVYIPKATGWSSPNLMMSQRQRLTVKALRRPLTTGFFGFGAGFGVDSLVAWAFVPR